MKLRPLQDQVLIRRAEPEAETAGGIFIPEGVRQEPVEGEIVAAGSGARRKDGELLPMDVAVGDRVLFNKWSGAEIKLGGDELTIMKEAEILGVFDRPVAETTAA
jgi:chaperonin GroES